MQQQDLVNVILVLIEEKQNNGEFGTIRIEFRAGVIVDGKKGEALNEKNRSGVFKTYVSNSYIFKFQ